MGNKSFKGKKTLRLVPFLLGVITLTQFILPAQSGLVMATANSILTLSQAVDLALKADYQVKTDANDLEKSKLAVKKEALTILPQAAVDGQYQCQATDGTYPSSYQVVITETYPTGRHLYGQTVSSGMEAAMWDQMIAETTLRIDQAEVVYQTYEYYLNVLKIQQLIKQHEEAVANYKESNALAIKQLSMGKITKPDQLKIEDYLNQAEYNLEKDRSDLDIALQKLANQIGMKDLSDYQLEEASTDTAAVADELEALQKKALEQRLELKKVDLNLKKAQQTWAQNKNNELPTVSFGYDNKSDNQSFGLSYNFLSGDVSGLAALKGGSYQSSGGTTSYFGNNQSYFTLKFSWSLDFGSAANQTKQSEYSLENAKLDWDKEQQDILLDVKQALADYRMAVKQHQLDMKSSAYYEKTVEIKKLQAGLGTITGSALSEAEQDALEARIAVVKSQYQQFLAFQKLQKVVGGLYLFGQESGSEVKKQ